MEEARRKIRICLISMILTAVVVGIFYYYYNGRTEISGSEGTLIQNQMENQMEEEYVC